MNTVFAVVLAMASGLPGMALADYKPQSLSVLWAAENLKCRGGQGNDPQTAAACAARSVYDQRLRSANWCYGKVWQSGFQMDWHPCGRDSLR